MQNKKYLIVDFEATCNNDDSFPRSEMEIIEIGAVICEYDNNNRPVNIQKFNVFVTPTIHPQLTEFCKTLTNIKQEDVDNGLPFPEAYEKFKNWVEETMGVPTAAVYFSSWGAYDHRQLARDCKLHNLPFPKFIFQNVKENFSLMVGEKPMGVGKALRFVRMRFEGSPHRAIDDAMNIARLLPYSHGFMVV